MPLAHTSTAASCTNGTASGRCLAHWAAHTHEKVEVMLNGIQKE